MRRPAISENQLSHNLITVVENDKDALNGLKDCDAGAPSNARNVKFLRIQIAKRQCERPSPYLKSRVPLTKSIDCQG